MNKFDYTWPKNYLSKINRHNLVGIFLTYMSRTSFLNIKKNVNVSKKKY